MLNKNNLNNKTDEELVSLTLGDQENFVYLIKRYEDKLLRYVRRISNLDYEDAEDMVQEVFIKVYQNLNAFDPKLKFSSWIYRITHNQVISNYRKLKARPQNVMYDMENDILENMASDLDIAKEADKNLLKEKVNNIINKMDLKYRQVMVLKYLEEKNYNEISDILKKPKGTVSTLINRAKKQFQKELNNSNIKL